MANINLTWVVEGIISPEVSVTNMIKVIQSKGIQHSGTFWTWEDKVSSIRDVSLITFQLTFAAT